MRYSVSLEEVEGRWVAFVPALLGCFTSTQTRDAALAALPAAVRDYGVWRQSKGDSFSPDADPDFDIAEIVREWPNPADPEYIVSAFFAADAPPLTGDEIGQGLHLLGWTHEDLLAAGQVSHDALTRPVEDGWSIESILKHCSRAEWWYLSRLGLAPSPGSEPTVWQERLAIAHRQLLAVLPQLQGVTRLELKNAELWSPRKLLRRALWHERDHTQHIQKFRAILGI